MFGLGMQEYLLVIYIVLFGYFVRCVKKILDKFKDL